MTLKTRPSFYFGHEVTSANYLLPFKEGSLDLLAELTISAFSLTDFVAEISRAMNEVSDIENNYIATVDRDTRIITISGDNNFTLLAGSSDVVSASVFNLAGFNVGFDYTGSNSYTGQNPSGLVYKPQFLLQSFVDFDNDQMAASASVQTSATGVTQVVTYGVNKFMSFNIKYANDYIREDGDYIENNQNAVNELRSFMEYIVKKFPIEFNYDREDASNYRECLLEKTPESAQGVNFKLKEQYGENLIGYFQTGIIKFREI